MREGDRNTAPGRAVAWIINLNNVSDGRRLPLAYIGDLDTWTQTITAGPEGAWPVTGPKRIVLEYEVCVSGNNTPFWHQSARGHGQAGLDPSA